MIFSSINTKNNLISKLENTDPTNILDFYKQNKTEIFNILQEKIDKNIFSLKFISKNQSIDNKTIKVLFKTQKNNFIESVFMQYKDHSSVCVSTMSGCPVGCIFCQTGKMGFLQNLDFFEIVEQVLFFKKINKTVNNVVYMGMGEPLLNIKNSLLSIFILNEFPFFNIGKRKITLSTVGIPQGLKTLIDINFKSKLAFSLHAPNQELREKLIPIAKQYPLSTILPLLDKFYKKNKRRITIEYILIDGINNTLNHALNLINMIKNKNRNWHINLIPINSPNKDLKRPSEQSTKAFLNLLKKEGIEATIRQSFGQDINAACGQLAKHKIKNKI